MAHVDSIHVTTGDQACTYQAEGRYERQTLMPQFGEAAQEKLAAAKITAIGAGGLGSPALLYLAAAGVGHIHIVDNDVVDSSNLHRQVLHTEDRVGVSKLESAVTALRERNSDIEITVSQAMFTEETGPGLVEGSDLVVDGTDNYPARYAIDKVCSDLDMPCVWGSVLGFEGQVSVFRKSWGATYSGLFPSRPPVHLSPSCNQAGVLGPVCGTVGTLMAVEVIKVITGIGTPLIGRLHIINAFDGTLMTVPINAAPRDMATKRSVEHVDFSFVSEVVEQEAGTWDVLDVRTEEEYAEGHIPHAMNIPTDRLAAEIDKVGDHVVVYCLSGARARDAADWIATQGDREIKLYSGSWQDWQSHVS